MTGLERVTFWEIYRGGFKWGFDPSSLNIHGMEETKNRAVTILWDGKKHPIYFKKMFQPITDRIWFTIE